MNIFNSYPPNRNTLIFALLMISLSCSLIFNSARATAQTFNYDHFDDNSISINNPWFPLRPGTQWIYEGYTEEDGKKVPHKIVSTVTDLVKNIDNVATVVLFEKDFSQNNLTEAELVFYATDKDNNIWHFGQYSEVYDTDGELVGGRAWLVGCLEGARAGIMMQAHPKPGTASYEQGYAPPPFNWTDRARVAKLGQKRKVPFGNYDDVLVIEEYSDSEPKAIQLKYFARGIGNIEVGWKGQDELKETLKLVKMEQLSPIELAKVRDEALMLEERAYVYSKTAPAKPFNHLKLNAHANNR